MFSLKNDSVVPKGDILLMVQNLKCFISVEINMCTSPFRQKKIVLLNGKVLSFIK